LGWTKNAGGETLFGRFLAGTLFMSSQNVLPAASRRQQRIKHRQIFCREDVVSTL